jgi:hypothetical protein
MVGLAFAQFTLMSSLLSLVMLGLAFAQSSLLGYLNTFLALGYYLFYLPLWAGIVTIDTVMFIGRKAVHSFCVFRDDYLNPFYLEYARFKSIFKPIEVSIFDSRCWRRTSGGVSDSYWPLQTTAESYYQYLKDPTYWRIRCVYVNTWHDVALWCVVALMVVVAMLAVWNTVYAALHLNDPMGRVWRSKLIALLSDCTKQCNISARTLRSMFSNIYMIKNRISTNHTHPLSAAVRTASSSSIELFCKMLGKEPYYLQLSPADIKKGRNGTRTYHWAKDLSVQVQTFAPKTSDIIVGIDVDMYLDVPNMLATTVAPYIFSTFQPTAVSGDCGEYSYTFFENDEVEYVVSGGAIYRHHVWNYSHDIIVCSARTWRGLGVRTVVYNVDRKQIGLNHQLIMLSPLKTFVSPLFDLSWLVEGHVLDRLHVFDRGFLRLRVVTESGNQISTSRVGEHNSVTIPIVLDDALANIAEIGKTELTIAGVRQVVEGLDVSRAAVLVAYHRLRKSYSVDKVFPVKDSVKHYQFDPKMYDPEAKITMIPFMAPIIDECFAPVASFSNDEATILGRVIEVKASDDLEITELELKFMTEFVELLVGDKANTGVPLSIDDVYERQHRPSQRTILNKAVDSYEYTVNKPVDSFQKRESYQDVKDPRNISTIPGPQKLHYSRYMYAFSDNVLKHLPWYAFSKTPLEVAQRVTELCENALHVDNTDLSRMDGRVSKKLRVLESMYMQRWASASEKATLAELMATQVNQRGFTKFGKKYDTGYSRLSGSPETSCFNTVDNAYMAYSALRSTRTWGGEFMSPSESWKGLGIYGGDDGITADVSDESYVSACKAVGQVLDIVRTKRGERGVTFLSRYYSDEVWYGNPNSICDVRRQLAKIHVTHNLNPNVSPIEKLSEKMSGLFLTDRNTPIIGDLAKLTIDLNGMSPLIHGISSYFSRFPYHQQFPNTCGGWAVDYVKDMLPDFDYHLFNDWINKVRIGQADLLKPPLCIPGSTESYKVKRPVVINGVDFAPMNPYDKCKHRVEGDCTHGERCIHLVKKTKCGGENCSFKHKMSAKTEMRVRTSQSE